MLSVLVVIFNPPPTRNHGACSGARVHSDSWGGADATYDLLAYDVDHFAWQYQDFLPCFAGGNFGGDDTPSSVNTPSVAKNCVAVGVL